MVTSNITNIFCDREYKQPMYTIREYGSYYKTTLFKKALRTGGLEVKSAVKVFTPKCEGGNSKKLSNNICRARSTVAELADCNPWELFVTFTIDKEKHERYDLHKYKKDLTQFLRDYRKKTSADIKYLLVPEKHKDGAWHLHGFIHGLPLEHLHAFTLSEKLPARIRQRLSCGTKVYTWKPYENKFGFASIEVIDSKEAAGRYILKYITEDLNRTITELNAHLFYASKGLRRSTVLAKDIAEHGIDLPSYENDYCSVKISCDLYDALCAVLYIEGKEEE